MSTDDPKYQVTRVKAPTFTVAEGISLADIDEKVQWEWSMDERVAMEVLRRIVLEGGEEAWCNFMHEVGEETWNRIVGWSQPMAVVQPPDYGDPEWDPDYWPQWEVHITEVPYEERKRLMTYLRRRYGMSLMDAKQAVDTLPCVLRKGLSKPEAMDLLPDLVALGCTAEVVVGERME